MQCYNDEDSIKDTLVPFTITLILLSALYYFINMAIERNKKIMQLQHKKLVEKFNEGKTLICTEQYESIIVSNNSWKFKKKYFYKNTKAVYIGNCKEF